MRPVQLLALAAVAVSAQSANYTSSLDMTVDPGSVQDSKKSDWCRSQRNACDTLCNDSSNTNDCSISTLKYECTCSSNNSAPGLQYYDSTMPTFICKELFSQCITQNAGDADGQKGCEEEIDAKCARTPVSEADTDSDDDDSEESSTTTGASKPSNTSDNDDSENSKNSDSDNNNDDDNFGVPVFAPMGMTVLAALGAVAVFF